MGGGGGGAGGGLITDANARLLVEDDVAGDTEAIGGTINDTPLFDFSTDVDPPSIVAGSALGIGFDGYYRLTFGVSGYLHSGILGGAVYLGPGIPLTPEFASLYPIGFRQVYSQIDGNVSWPVTPAAWGCGLGAGSWGSWHEQEYWRPITIPAHPVDMAGITVSGITVSNFTGAATGARIRVTSSTPSVGKQGEIVAAGPLAAGAHSVFIPGSLVPAEGGTLWVGVCPAWECDYDFSDGHPGDGSQGQCCLSFHPPFRTGEGNSGAMNVDWTTWGATWAVYSAPGEGAFGTIVINDDEDQPFEGGNDVVDFGGEGSPIYGVQGGAFYVTGPGSRCIGAVGDGEVADEDETEDETGDQPMGIWADPWSPRGEFEVDALGASTGSIEWTTNRGGSITVGTIHLGPTPGISVTTESGTEFEAVAITPGRWGYRFDDRSETVFRGKVWLASLGEPADWNVEVALPEEDDDEEEGVVDEYKDRFVVCLKADEDQTIRLYPPTAQGTGSNALVKERLGWASGDTDRFTASMPFMPGAVEFEVAGVFVPPTREDPDTGDVWLDYQPTRGMIIWLRYQAE